MKKCHYATTGGGIVKNAMQRKMERILHKVSNNGKLPVQAVLKFDGWPFILSLKKQPEQLQTGPESLALFSPNMDIMTSHAL